MRNNDRYRTADIVAACQQYWPETHMLAHSLVIYLNRMNEHQMMEGSKSLLGFGLSLTEFDVLVTLRRSASPHVLTPTELQRSLLVTSGGLTKLLYQLEARGLVSRSVQMQDKRSKLVHLTGQGCELAEKVMYAILAASTKRFDAALNKKEQEQLIKLLGKIALATEGG
ncbi:MarR family winged helix-turn-helix transcriptional regulator [Thiothrix lacustris]|jgi:DNA-binding MarR family transcriptional regulator|uniref:MarR family winged helix-turn-helix transcriptional regulator n=1 Tax=Thiothrix lacustris TaxID=525917 RepID=UPI000688C613|nr:MarR family transcriptional regulator [Thiothrix lacustris]